MPKFITVLKVLCVVFFAYLILCLSIYAMQKNMLFPAYATKPVAADWHPKGENSEQALIDGSCGKLSVAIWRTPNAKGTLMMSHGNGESLASIDDYAYAFQDLGYNLMAWDYPGYGRSSNCWFSQKMLLDDAESAYQWLASKEDKKRIYIFGYSIGTGVALSLASRHQQNPVYLVAAYDALLKVAIDRMPSFVPVSFLLRYPMQTNRWLDVIKQPVYLIHGRQDVLIRPARALSLTKQANGKAKIEWVENAGHADDTLFAYRNSWLKRLLP